MISEQVIDQICSAYGLGRPLSHPTIILGSRVHQLWYLSTSRGDYVIKKFNLLHSWGAHTEDELIQTENIVHTMQKADIPALSAKMHKDKPYFKFEDDYYLLYDRIRGEVISAKEATLDQIVLIAKMIAKMHDLTLDLPARVLSSPFYIPLHWQLLVQCACVCNFSGKELLLKMEPSLKTLMDKVSRAKKNLQNKLVLSHGDLDPQNVIWRTLQDPIIIDWEGVGKVNPMVELVATALSWSMVDTRKLNMSCFQAFCKAYHDAGREVTSDLRDAFYLVMGLWMQWVQYNLERFVGEEFVDSLQQRKSEIEAEKTLFTVDYLLSLPEESWQYLSS